jgi:hypothetical protein
MSLFNSQTIFNILITLIICSALFIFFRFKLRVLEISQREQAKVLQSLVMNIRHGGHPRNANMDMDMDMDMENNEQAMKHIQMMQMQTQMQHAGASDHARRANDLIDVSDEEDDDDDDDEDTDSSSDSEDDDTDSSSSEDDNDDNEENHENTTKKIIFNNGGALDTHAHNVEHLTGDDIKVIELSEPLYPVGGNAHGSKNSSHHDTNDVSDDEDASDDDNDEDMSDDVNDDEETSDDTEVKAEELPSHEHEHHQHLETSVTDIDTTEIKTIFKADKQQQQQQQQTHQTDYNSMNVQTLKQQLKTKLTAEGMPYNETAINKLNKKELIKHLTQG